MARVVIDSRLTKNPKFFDLMSELNVGKRDLLWMLYQLWGWVADHYPDGNLVGVSEASLVYAMDSTREPKAVAQALEKTGFLDTIPDGWHIHDWTEWRAESVRSRQRRMVERPTSDQDPTSSPHPVVVSAVVLSFPSSGEPKTWELREDMLQRLTELYPSVDVLAESKKALFWVESNPTKKKTARGMPKFLASWMERQQNRYRGPGVKSPETDKAENAAIYDRVRRQREETERIISEYKQRGKQRV